ncbi:hypothetical protein Tco_0441812 [Tanacetum coccineum]
MKTNQINLFTQSSTSTDDLSDMDLKIKLLNRIHSNKSDKTHTTHQQLYDTLYESITFNQDTLDAQAAQSSFHKRSHDNQDPPNNREGENKKKHQKDVGEPSSRSSSVAIAKKFKELIQKDKLTIAYLEGTRLERLKVQYKIDVELEYHVSQLKAAVLSEAQWNSDEGDVSKPRLFERHISKSTKPHPCFYNKDYTYLVDLNTEEKYTTYITKHYAARYYNEGIKDRIPLKDRTKKFVAITLKLLMVYTIGKRIYFEALNQLRSDDKEYEFSYADLPKLNVNDFEDMYLLQVQDKKIFNSEWKAIKELLTLPNPQCSSKESTKGYHSRSTHKGVVYLNQYNIKSLMKLSEVKKFCDGTLIKIQENLIDMLSKNKLGSRNKRLKGRDWTNYDVKSSKQMLKKIDEILRHREQLKRLEEYVGGRPKTVNPVLL